MFHKNVFLLTLLRLDLILLIDLISELIVLSTHLRVQSYTNTRTRCEICPKLTINTPEIRQSHNSSAVIVNFEHISHLFQVFLLLSLTR